MSLFVPVQAKCSACGSTAKTELAASVNADRRPDLRQAILDGSFQSMACPNCGESVRMPAHLTYIDVGRRQWFLVEDVAQLAEWREAEAEATELYDRSFGPSAPAPQRMVMEGVEARLVFGWPGLREKLLAAEAGLDDKMLELLKIGVLRNVKGPPFADGTELRLVGTVGSDLALAWLQSATEAFVVSLTVPRSIYDDLAANLGPWAELRADLSAGLFVDMNRLVLA